MKKNDKKTEKEKTIKKETKKVEKKKSTKTGKNANSKKKVENIQGNSLEIRKVIRIIIWVVIFFAFFYLLTYILVGDLIKDKETDEVETSIQYEEILAGSSFKMNASKYLVVYYDSTADDASDISNAIYTYKYSTGDTLALYTVDLSNALNKNAIADGASNKDPENASELAINGPTLIRFRDGDVREYIEGTSKVIKYLTN